MLWDVVVCNLHRQGDVLWAIGAAGTDLCREAFDPAWRREPTLQYRLLEHKTEREKGYLLKLLVLQNSGFIRTYFTAAWLKFGTESEKHSCSIKIHIFWLFFFCLNWNHSSVEHRNIICRSTPTWAKRRVSRKHYISTNIITLILI